MLRFPVLETNRFLGLLRMDLLTVIFIPLYYLIFLGIFLALNGQKNPWTIIALLSVFVGRILIQFGALVFSILMLPGIVFNRPPITSINHSKDEQ